MKPYKSNNNHYTIAMHRLLFFVSISILKIHHLDAQDIEYARKVVEDLTSPAMHGRGYVYNGINKAAKYVIREYKKNGTVPVNGSYSQWFRERINTFPGPVKLSINETMMKPGIDFLPDPSASGIEGTYGLIEISLAEILHGTGNIKAQQATQDHLLYLNLSKSDTLDELQKKAVTAFRNWLKTGD